MNYIEFCIEIRNHIESMIGEGFSVRLIAVEKLNGVYLQSIIIQKNNETITPNIYLEEYYDQYLQGNSITLLAADIISCYSRVDKSFIPNVSHLMDFNIARDRIFLKLINYNKNKELLKDLPHIRFLDLAIIFCVLVSKDENGIGSFNIKKELTDKWGVNIDTIYKHARENTPQLFGSRVRPMEDIITDIIKRDLSSEESPEVLDELIDTLLPDGSNIRNKQKMFVGTNSIGINGAAWILYKNELLSLSNELCSDLYILPSSIHEVIIIPACDQLQKDHLLDMVIQINAQQVPIQEVLSDNIYFYNKETDEITSLYQ